ncbi:MAG: dephospho-CoA kinase [Acidobacteria bacterium]|nr:MAG: dephospho-CoA kinase [Acidobacteriota bacterium]
MLRVGLTGSIGVGKSFVAGVLAELGCHVLDADQTARAVVEKGAPGLNAVVKAFGENLLHDDGTLDRQKLADIIFTDEAQRELLNSILHPYIIAAQDEQMRRWEKDDPDGIAVIDAALMIESGGYRRFDKLIVVYCRPEIQLQRVITRTGLSDEEALQRINAQMSQDDKKKFADYLIDTSDGFEAARNQTQKVYERLLQDKTKNDS